MSKDGRCGLGAVIRNHDSQVMAAATWCFSCLSDPEIVEAFAIRLGLKFSLDLLFLNLEVETDALNVILGLQNRLSSHSCLGSILSHCHFLESSFQSISYAHVNRKGNQVAHVLAKYALDHPDQL